MKKVLFVDEHALNHIVLRQYFKINHVDVDFHSAFDGMDALDTLENDSNFDLIIIDYELPDMDGVKANQIIKSFWPHLIVTLHSYHDNLHVNHKYRKYGFDILLEKPLGMDSFKQFINYFEEIHEVKV